MCCRALKSKYSIKYKGRCKVDWLSAAAEYMASLVLFSGPGWD